MTALVIGASGLVGSSLMQALAEAGEAALGTYATHAVPGLVALDVRDPDAVRACSARSGADIVYVPASLTNVDYCETHEADSLRINVDGVRHIVACGRRLVYFSSDYVFAGDAGPYRETDPVRPLSVYGQHKLLAERALPPDALIVRTTVVFGWEALGKNFLYRLRRTLSEGQPLRVPADQVGSPTYAPNLARAAVVLAQSGATGVYHVAGPLRASRYEFALAAARVFGLDPGLVQPVRTADLGQAAPRPLNAGMICEKAQAVLPFPLVDYHEGVRLFWRQVEGDAVSYA